MISQGRQLFAVYNSKDARAQAHPIEKRQVQLEDAGQLLLQDPERAGYKCRGLANKRSTKIAEAPIISAICDEGENH